jgi:putative glutamine amidotransferase
MKPIIGIPLCLDDRGRWKSTRCYHYIDTAYAQAIEAAGGIPVYLPLQEDPSSLSRKLDGLLLPGGDDLPPPREYPAGVEFDLVPEVQRRFDRRLLDDALSRNLPLLAICYGMQLLALASGGKLYYDIPTDVPGSGPHRLPEGDGRHGLRVEPGTRLSAALDAQSASVNSLHHQGVESVGAGFRVAARAEDGLIEAIEREGSHFCIGVQWHPEKLTGPHGSAVFRALMTACS